MGVSLTPIRTIALLSVLLISIHQTVCEKKFTVESPLDQIVAIIEKSAIPLVTSRLDLLLTRQHLNYLVPFDVKLSCEIGEALIRNVSRIYSENILQETTSEYEAMIKMQFNVTKIDFKYDNCSLTIMIPMPFSLKGSFLNSSFSLTSKVLYKPRCKMIAQSTALAYDKLELDLFKWFPGKIGDFITDVLTRNVKDRIHSTAVKSVQKTIERLSVLYNPCMAFPRTKYVPVYRAEMTSAHEFVFTDNNTNKKYDDARRKSGHSPEL